MLFQSTEVADQAFNNGTADSNNTIYGAVNGLQFSQRKAKYVPDDSIVFAPLTDVRLICTVLSAPTLSFSLYDKSIRMILCVFGVRSRSENCSIW